MKRHTAETCPMWRLGASRLDDSGEVSAGCLLLLRARHADQW